MNVTYDHRSNDPIYYLHATFRDASGKVTSKNIEVIGRHSELAATHSDPLAYAKEYARKKTEEAKSSKAKVQLTCTLDMSSQLRTNDRKASSSRSLNVGYLYLQALYHQMEIRGFMEKIQNESRCAFDFDELNRFLIFSRILDHSSKLQTYELRKNYYEQPDFGYHHILRFMDQLDSHFDDYISCLYSGSEKVVKRNTSVCYYDCTNFYFETEIEDEYVDEVTGEICRGLRRYGPSKEHRPNPIVEMGLFMDKDGIPITMCIEPGSTNEQITAVPLEKKLIGMLDNKRLIYCADGGLGSFNIREFNSTTNRAFVVTQSIKKLSKVLQEAVFNDYDYKLLSNDQPVKIESMRTFDRHLPENLGFYNDRAYKVLIADKASDTGLTEQRKLKNGTYKEYKVKGVLKQRIIVTFSRKTMEYQHAVRRRQVERALTYLNSANPEERMKGVNDVRRFIKSRAKTEEGSEASITYELDEEKIREEEKYDGYYALATDLTDPAKDIFEINENRFKIEDCFRIMKTHFDARPVYHGLPQRIRAHFLICYSSLLIYRLLEKKINSKDLSTDTTENTGDSSSAEMTHFTPDDIIKTLRNMTIVDIGTSEDAFVANYTYSKCAARLEEVYELGLLNKYQSAKRMNKVVKKLIK